MRACTVRPRIIAIVLVMRLLFRTLRNDLHTHYTSVRHTTLTTERYGTVQCFYRRQDTISATSYDLVLNFAQEDRFQVDEKILAPHRLSKMLSPGNDVRMSATQQSDQQVLWSKKCRPMKRNKYKNTGIFTLRKYEKWFH